MRSAIRGTGMYLPETIIDNLTAFEPNTVLDAKDPQQLEGTTQAESAAVVGRSTSEMEAITPTQHDTRRDAVAAQFSRV